MNIPRIVIDTNVLVAALRSKQGASHRLLRIVDSGRFEVAVSVSLVLEYEASAKRVARQTSLTAQDVDAVIDYLCAVAVHSKVFYLWRPFLRDPKDDMVLELAVAAKCSHIVTFNTRDFAGTERFGIKNLRPQEFLKEIGAIKWAY